MGEAIDFLATLQQWLVPWLPEPLRALPAGETLLAFSFALSMIFSLIARNLWSLGGLAGFGWIVWHFALPTPVPRLDPEALRVLAGSCALLVGFAALLSYRQYAQQRDEAAMLEAELEDANRTIDRERLWRRVAGFEQESISDAEIQALWDKVGRTFQPQGLAVKEHEMAVVPVDSKAAS